MVCRLRHKTDGIMKMGLGHASKSSGLLRMKASWVRVSQSGLKTGGRAMASGARDTIAEVA
jgi:hypothetical protein